MSNSQSHPVQDWHRQEVIAAIRMRGISVAELARQNGYKNPTTFYNVFKAPYPKVEKIVAKFLGKQPADIWPSRYQPNPQVYRNVS
ncbi:helix-turn-helix transcriptional regulator [Oceanobacter sp. 4_MG-2023]|uniref:helix-turn-helix domain-containing protein n=1 Tax=Oceanobacter sp. 4_MG-2023 TaxID=3062623 RepID=UPI002734F11A|nr:helix-turn-helix transcriptional regulator [Oceanobacter sp. 4_MG-2023]MDP2549155.1 helix-turn-helix transcriptional regulator [Oceanobacter sp. 4_MG-2023]